jgi:hypothetical protein
LVGKIDFFLEAVGSFSTSTDYFINAGIIYNVTPNVKIDLGTNQGINDQAPVRNYIGSSFRI